MTTVPVLPPLADGVYHITSFSAAIYRKIWMFIWMTKQSRPPAPASTTHLPLPLPRTVPSLSASASSPMLYLSGPWNRYRPRRKTILRRGLLGFFSDNFLFLIFFTQCRFEIAVNQKNQQNQNDQRNGAEQNVGHNVTVLGSCNGQRPTQIFFRHGS